MKKLTDFQVENLIEETIINKTNLVSENFNKSFVKKWNKTKNKDERFKVLDEHFLTRKKLLSEGYNVELIDEGILGDILKGGAGGFISTFKEWLTNKLLGALGIQDPLLKKSIAIGIANLSWRRDFTKLLSPIKNCRYFSNVILDSIIEVYLNKKITDFIGTGGALQDSIRNAVLDALNSEKHLQSLEDSVGNVICSALEKLFGGGIKNTLKNVVSGFQSPQQPTPQPTV